MSRRHVQELSRVCEHLLKDAAQAFPALCDEFERDLKRIHNLVANRGIRLFTVDLPICAKHLDRCLDVGLYVPGRKPLMRPVNKTVVIPKLFRGLYLEIFNENGSLKDNPSIEAVFFLRQLLLFGKRTRLDCGSKAKRDEILEFLGCDYSLPKPFGIWRSSDPGGYYLGETLSFNDNFGWAKPTDAGVARFLENASKVAGILTATLGVYDPSEWRFRHGPGAISEVTGPTNKFKWRSWNERLESVFPIADYGYHSYSSWATSVGEYDSDYGYHDRNRSEMHLPPNEEEAYSRLICVPKTYTKPRLIAAEPASHQWCQQNIWHYFREKVRDSWIDNFVRFRDQSLNQSLCIEGSRDGRLATLDLSSASDRVTCAVVECVFGGNPALLRALAASRTRWVLFSSRDGYSYRRGLHKFSTMGSAVTFPVESLVFLVISLAAIITNSGQQVTMKNILALRGEVAVFGDDIVVPKVHREAVVFALEHCMFKVNASKSYGGDNFRESCGVDAFRGHVVTPVYWKGVNDGKPEAEASTIAVHNNLVNRFLLHTAGYIASTLRTRSHLPLVAPASGVVGLHCMSGSRKPLVTKRRWNRKLQREECLAATFRGEQQKVPSNDDSATFQYFTESPSPFDKWSHGVLQRPRLRMRRGWVATSEILARG